jgi:hypothetical protein
MVCPHCQSPRIRNLNRRTELGYAVFRCGACRRKCNERTGTPFNPLEFPTEIVFEIIPCRLLYKLSLRNLAQMFLLRAGKRMLKNGRNDGSFGTMYVVSVGSGVNVGFSPQRDRPMACHSDGTR